MCISDTHGNHNLINIPSNRAQCIIHSGDFTNRGSYDETIRFLAWFGSLKYKYKVLVAGNHDWYVVEHNIRFRELCKEFGIIYLEDEFIIIEGIKIYGTPWVPKFYNWAFMTEEYELRKIYSMIPDDTDVLITHGPAHLTLDTVFDGRYVGSESLRDRIDNLYKLKYHIFGHIHEARGMVKTEKLTSINASMRRQSEAHVLTFKV